MLGISAVSLRKYEYGERTPKDPMIAEIARWLEVNPSSLKSDWGSDANDAIHMLFELEEAFCLEPIKVGDTSSWLSGRLGQRGPGSTGEGASPLVQEQQGPEGRRANEGRVCCLEGLLQGLDSLNRTENGLVRGLFYAVTRS